MKEEEIYQKVLFWNKLNTSNQTYLLDTLKNQNSTLKPQGDNYTLSINSGFNFDRYLFPSVCVESRLLMGPVSTSMSSLSHQA